MFSYFGIVPPPMFGAASVPIADPPVITAQPQSQVLYQVGGPLKINGAAVTGYTSLQWQRLSNGNWIDFTGQTGLNFNAATVGNVPGQYRLKALNGNSAPAYSNEVQVISAYLSIVSDMSSNTGPDAVTKGANNQTYTGALLKGQRYYSARIIYAADGSDQGRAVASWTTSASAVAPISNVTATGQLRSDISTDPTGKSATITATYGLLTSTLKLTG